MKNLNSTLMRYIFFNIFKPFFLITFVLTGLVWLSRTLKYVDLIINKGLSLTSYFWFVSLIAPKILSLLLPLISFAAIVYTYFKLRSDSEIIAMETAGMSKLKLMIPALVFGLIMAALVIIIETKISPKNYKKFKSFQSDLRNSFAISSVQEGSFHSPIANITVYVDSISNNGTAKNILIHDTRNKNIESTILAKEGIMSNIHTNPYITVFNGSRYLNYKNSNETSVLKFDKYEFKIKQVNNTTNIRFRHVEERSLKELFIPDEKLNNKVKNEFYSEGHRRLSSPLLLIFMCTTAACTILFGKMRKKLSSKKIFAVSTLAIFIQSLYIGFINNMSFTINMLFILYFSLFFLSVFPIIIIKYEKFITNILKNKFNVYKF